MDTIGPTWNRTLTPEEKRVYRAKVKVLGLSMAVTYMWDSPHITLTCDDEKREGLYALRDAIFEYWKLVDPEMKDRSRAKGVIWELARQTEENPFGCFSNETLKDVWNKWDWCIDSVLDPEKLRRK